MSNVSRLAAEFSQSSPLEFQKLVRRLAETIDRFATGLEAAVKWRQLVFAKNGDFHHWILAITLTKKSVNLHFHYGSLLDDPKGLLVAGSSRFLRKIEFASADELDEGALLDLVAQAVDKHQYFKENWKRIQAEG